MPRKPTVVTPTGAELERAVLVALLAAGGTQGRHTLREGLPGRVRAAEFDAAVAVLKERRQVREVRQLVSRESLQGWRIPYWATEYTLTAIGRREAKRASNGRG